MININDLENSLSRDEMRTLFGGATDFLDAKKKKPSCSDCSDNSECASGVCAKNYPVCDELGMKCM